MKIQTEKEGQRQADDDRVVRVLLQFKLVYTWYGFILHMQHIVVFSTLTC